MVLKITSVERKNFTHKKLDYRFHAGIAPQRSTRKENIPPDLYELYGNSASRSEKLCESFFR